MANTKNGYFCFVLHSHLPYVRNAGRWPHGEEMVHEALAETYIPLLNALFDLKGEGLNPKLTIGLTPILVEQLSDKDVNGHFELYLSERLEMVQRDIDRFERNERPHLAYLANFYRDWYRYILESYIERYERNVIKAFARLQREGNVDIITSAATHCYLPLTDRDSTIYAQLRTGIDSYRRHFGVAPRGIWLPECGYRPGYYKTEDAVYKPGIEEFLSELNLGYFFTDTHNIEGGDMVGKAAGDATGPYEALPRRQLATRRDTRPHAKNRSTFRPYYVESSDVAVFGREAKTGLQVWSAAYGYPGDFVYREFHRKDSHSGMQYWKITGVGIGLGDKEFYDPVVARGRATDHANHFVGLVEGLIADYRQTQETPGIIVSAYDTELFGHWWFEGIDWLKDVLRQLARSETVGLCSARDYLATHPPSEVISLPESSWGLGGGHWTWSNPETEWMWSIIHACERRMEAIVEKYQRASGTLLAFLKQASRELVLLESSDWSFLITTGQAKEYANSRFQQHVARFDHLMGIIESGNPTEEDLRVLHTVAELDNPFPTIDYRLFKRREQIVDTREEEMELSASENP